MADMEIEQKQSVRYDRQIRLWGDEGQQHIRQARVCVFGSTALASETLKNLVLAGIGSFHIIDGALVDHEDLGQNFFLQAEDLGKLRGECVVKQLTELNPAVHGQFHAIQLSEFTRQDFQMLLQFSVVIAAGINVSEALQLDQFLFQHSIPFIWVRVCGMIGHLRLCFREHHIWNNNSENDAYDLRLDCPFPELLKLAQDTDLGSMTHEQHSHTPYVLLYLKALDEWRKCKRNEGITTATPALLFPDMGVYETRREFKQLLARMRQPDDKGSLDEQNFVEAEQNLLKSMRGTRVPDNVRAVLANPKAGPEELAKEIDKDWLDPFWVLSAALRQFIEHSNGQLMPISGQLPDMTSDSKRYAQLLGVYRSRKKSAEDAAQLMSFAADILARRRKLLLLTTSSSAITNSFPTTTTSSSDGDESMEESDTTSSSSDEETGSGRDSESESEGDSSGSEGARMSTSDPIEMANNRSGGGEKMEQDSSAASSMAADSTISSGLPPNTSNGLTTKSSATTKSTSGQTTKSSATTKTTSGSSSSASGPITLERCQSFLKTASKIGVQYGCSLSSEFGGDALNLMQIVRQIEPADMGAVPPRVHPLAWYLLLRAADRFRASQNRRPGSGETGMVEWEKQDAKELGRHMGDLLAETKDPDLISAREQLVPGAAVREVCRFGGSEPHTVAAMLGGCAAQEAIKLCTHQYMPVDNSLLFDAHTQQAMSFRGGGAVAVEPSQNSQQ